MRAAYEAGAAAYAAGGFKVGDPFATDRRALENHVVRRFGVMWESLDAKPLTGTELPDAHGFVAWLKAAPAGRLLPVVGTTRAVLLSRLEWDAFGVTDLRAHHDVEADGVCFRPVGTYERAKQILLMAVPQRYAEVSP